MAYCDNDNAWYSAHHETINNRENQIISKSESQYGMQIVVVDHLNCEWYPAQSDYNFCPVRHQPDMQWNVKFVHQKSNFVNNYTHLA
jgi:hypothetical protein